MRFNLLVELPLRVQQSSPLITHRLQDGTSFGEFLPARLVSRAAPHETPFSHLLLLTNDRITCLTLHLDLLVQLGHLIVEVFLGRLLDALLFRGEGRDFSVSCEVDLLPLWTLHVVELVNVRVLVLILILSLAASIVCLPVVLASS